MRNSKLDLRSTVERLFENPELDENELLLMLISFRLRLEKLCLRKVFSTSLKTLALHA
jgi:hypothetical protein